MRRLKISSTYPVRISTFFTKNEKNLPKYLKLKKLKGNFTRSNKMKGIYKTAKRISTKIKQRASGNITDPY